MAILRDIRTKVWAVFLPLAVMPFVTSLEVDSWCPSSCRCNRTDMHVDCSDAGLTYVPPNTPSETVFLDLSANPLGQLTTFPNLGRLRVLRISRHSLGKLASNSLRPLKSLRILDLSNNFLEVLPTDIAPISLDTLILSGNLMLKFENDTQPILSSQSLRTLDMSHCNINQLPQFAFSSLHYLQHLDLSNNFIYTLHPDLFSPLSALISLNLSNNRLSPIPDTIFQNNPFLTSLNLSGNIWNLRFMSTRNSSSMSSAYLPSDIPNDPILRSLSLEHLDISGCWLSQLTSESLASLPKLRSLSLAETSLRRVDRKVFEHLVNLEKLDISYNRFGYMYDDLFKTNHKLTSFTCSPCSFVYAFLSTTGPDKTIQSTSISYLNLKGTPLGGMLTNMAKFPELTTLLLSNTEITSVSSTAFSLNPHLTEVDLSDCKLRQLPPTIFISNPKLTKIKLSNNLLGRYIVSTDNFPVTTATYLDLSDCNYHNISKKYFSNLHSLVYLNLSGNPLVVWEDGAFSELCALQSLDLSRTLLIHLDPNSFITNSALESLFLSSVRLGAAIFKNSFSNGNDTSSHFINIPMLKELDLSNCGIQHLTKQAFSGTPALNKLSLSGNGLRSLDVSSIKEHLFNLTFLNLQDNPWRCDCTLAFLRDWWLEQNMEPHRHWVICEEPENLRDRTWDAIDNCSDSVSRKNNIPSNQALPKEDELLKSSSDKGAITKVNKNDITEKPSTVINTDISITSSPDITTVTRFVKKSYIEIVKTTFSPVLFDKVHDSKLLHVYKPPPPNQKTENSAHSIKIAKGVLIGFFGMVLICFIGYIFFRVVFQKRYKRLSRSITSETTAVWEL